MQPHNPEHQFAAPFKKAPLKFLYDHCGGQVMFVALLGFLIGLFFVTTPHLEKYVILYGATLGGLLVRSIGEDKYVIQTKIKNEGNANAATPIAH